MISATSARIDIRSGMVTSASGSKIRYQGHHSVAVPSLVRETEAEWLPGGENQISVLKSKTQREEDLALCVHPAVHAFFHAVDRPKSNVSLPGELGLRHQLVLSQFAHAIAGLSPYNFRIIHVTVSLLSRTVYSEIFPR